MSYLDDPAFLSKQDPKGMMAFTEGFSDQCRKALSIAKTVDLPNNLRGCDQIVVLGMGGSAAGGDYLRELVHAQGKVPCMVCRDYMIPSFVSERTLVIACSYSGNTEETLSSLHQAHEKGARVFAVTSGGEIAKFCTQNGCACITIPDGQPPRTALGFLFIPMAHACAKLGYFPMPDFEKTFELLDRCSEEWSQYVKTTSNPTKMLALSLYAKAILIYGLGSWQSVAAYRWKGQINENSKMMAFYHAFPELNHNEIMGWTLAEKQGVDRWATVILASGGESKKMRTRADVTGEIIHAKTDLHEVHSLGDDLLSQMLSLTYFGDFVSLYLAAMNEVDPEAIDAINTLKSRLAEV